MANAKNEETLVKQGEWQVANDGNGKNASQNYKSGVLVPAEANWEKIFRTATEVARQHSASFGCRSLDVLHCVAALVVEAGEFLTTDIRQKQLAGSCSTGLGLADLQD